MTQIRTKAALRELMQEALPDLVREEPQVILDALGENKDEFARAMEKLGFIVGEDTGSGRSISRMVQGVHEEAFEQGRVIGGFGARYRRAMQEEGHARKWTDPLMRRERVNYLWDRELQPLLDQWVRALLSHNYVLTVEDAEGQKSQRMASDIAQEINDKTRAPSFPLTVEDGTSGGVLVPTIVAAQIFEETTERFVLQNLVNVFTSAAPLRIPRRTTLIQVSRAGSQAGNITEQDPNILGFVNLSPERVAAISYIQPRLVQAAAVGPVQYIIGQFAEAMARDNQRVIVAGLAANSEPRGINTLPTSGTPTYNNAKTATWVNTDNVTRRNSMRQFLYALSQFHRMAPGFRYIMNSDAIAMLAGLNDLNQVVFRDAEGTRPERYLNKEIVETTALATVTNATTVLEGDLQQYAWQEAPGGLRMEQTTIGGEAFESDTIGIKVVQEVDGAPVIPPAFGKMDSVDV